MPKSKHQRDANKFVRGSKGLMDVGLQYPTRCRANDSCPFPPVGGARVALCGKHMREVYEDAQDVIARRWEDGLREFIAESLPSFKPPAAVVRRPRPGWVYFARFGARIKVGYSEDVDRRMQAIPHDEILGIVPGTYGDEQAWHRLLAEFRVSGEWYEARPEVLEQIRAVVQASAGRR